MNKFENVTKPVTTPLRWLMALLLVAFVAGCGGGGGGQDPILGAGAGGPGVVPPVVPPNFGPAGAGPALGAAAPFGALTCQALTGGTVATGTTVNGDIGTTLTSASITNFVGGGAPATPSTATGTVFASDLPTPGNTTTATAIADSNTARLAGAAAGALGTLVSTADLGGQVGFGPNPLTPGTFLPGAYRSGSSMAINTPITLDAQGNSNAVWIFFMPASTLTTTILGNVVLANGALARNVFWIVGSSATLGAPLFNGNILAATAITVSIPAGGIVNGRLQTSGPSCAAVSFAGSGGAHTVNVP